MKRAFLLLLFISALALITSFYDQVSVIQDPMETKGSQPQSKHQTQEHPSNDHAEHAHSGQQASGTSDDIIDKTTPLDPEIRKALKQQLLLEGPMETQTLPDGRIVLPSNGRTTQMPVAIQHPDGTIEIKEYSVVPEESSP